MSREKMVSAKSCGTDQMATAQLMVRSPPGANSYLPLNWLAGRRTTRPHRHPPPITPPAPMVRSRVPMTTPNSVVRNGANHWEEFSPELGATHPTDHEPIVSTTEPKNPITMAGQACCCVPLRACSKVVMNGFHSISLISMTLGINVSPESGRLNIDTLGRRSNLDNSTTSPQPFEPVSESSKDQDRNLVWLDAEMTGLCPGLAALLEF